MPPAAQALPSLAPLPQLTTGSHSVPTCSSALTGADSAPHPPVGSSLISGTRACGNVQELQAQMENMQQQFMQALDIITERVDLKIGKIADVRGGSPAAAEVAPSISMEVARFALGGAGDAPIPAPPPAPAASPSADQLASARKDAQKEQSERVRAEIREELRRELREELRGELALVRGELWSELSGALRCFRQELAELRSRQDHFDEACESMKKSRDSRPAEVTRCDLAALQSQQDVLRRETDLRLGHLLGDMEALRRVQLLGEAGTRHGSALPPLPSASAHGGSEPPLEVAAKKDHSPGRNHRKKNVTTPERAFAASQVGNEHPVTKAGSGDASSSDGGSLSSEFYASTASTSIPGKAARKLSGSPDSDYMLEACTGKSPDIKGSFLGRGRFTLMTPALDSLSAREAAEQGEGDSNRTPTDKGPGLDIQALRQQWHEQLSVLDKHINDIETMNGQKSRPS